MNATIMSTMFAHMAKSSKQLDENTPAVPNEIFAAAKIEAVVSADAKPGEIPAEARKPVEASLHIVPTGEPNAYDVILKVGGKSKFIERGQSISMCSKACLAQMAHLALWAQNVRTLETGDVG